MVHYSLRRIFWRSTVAIGFAITLSGCGETAASGNKTIFFDEADREISVQPIQVCDDFGKNCARMNLFAEITSKILEQAKLKVNFLPANRLDSSRFLKIGDEKNSVDELYELSRRGKNADYGRHEESTRTEGPINVWFVEEILSPSGSIQFGSAWVDANGVIISEETIDYDGGKGRPDTLAHELGHNLGLKHTTFGAGGADNLLTEGNKRDVPSDINDIYSKGGKTSRLTAAQINEIANSGFVIRKEDVALAGEETLSVDVASADLTRSDLSKSLTGLDLAESDLASFSLTSFQLKAAADSRASSVPEPSSWFAMGCMGLSSMVLLKRRSQLSQRPKLSVSSCLTPYV